MAGKIGIDRSYLSQLETGSREIHKWIADRVEAIAKENRVQVDGWPDLVVEKSTNRTRCNRSVSTADRTGERPTVAR